MGSRARPVQPVLRRGEYVATSAGNTALTSACDGRAARMFSVGSVRPPVLQPQYTSVYADGSKVYVVHQADGRHSRASLAADGRQVRLANGFDPAGVTAGVVAGTVHSKGGRRELGVLADATSGRVTARIGFPLSLSAGAGRVIGTYGCRMMAARACDLRSIDVHTQVARAYEVPRSPGIGGTVVSPDGRAVAFPLERAADHRYDQGEHSACNNAAAARHRQARHRAGHRVGGQVGPRPGVLTGRTVAGHRARRGTTTRCRVSPACDPGACR